MRAALALFYWPVVGFVSVFLLGPRDLRFLTLRLIAVRSIPRLNSASCSSVACDTVRLARHVSLKFLCIFKDKSISPSLGQAKWKVYLCPFECKELSFIVRGFLHIGHRGFLTISSSSISPMVTYPSSPASAIHPFGRCRF